VSPKVYGTLPAADPGESGATAAAGPGRMDLAVPVLATAVGKDER
jgi:hypothetical protein